MCLFEDLLVFIRSIELFGPTFYINKQNIRVLLNFSLILDVFFMLYNPMQPFYRHNNTTIDIEVFMSMNTTYM